MNLRLPNGTAKGSDIASLVTGFGSRDVHQPTAPYSLINFENCRLSRRAHAHLCGASVVDITPCYSHREPTLRESCASLSRVSGRRLANAGKSNPHQHLAYDCVQILTGHAIQSVKDSTRAREFHYLAWKPISTNLALGPKRRRSPMPMPRSWAKLVNPRARIGSQDRKILVQPPLQLSSAIVCSSGWLVDRERPRSQDGIKCGSHAINSIPVNGNQNTILRIPNTS